MQSVAELALLQVADEAIDARDRLARLSRDSKTEIVLHARHTRFLADRRDQALTPRRIKTVGGRILVEQFLQPHGVSRQGRLLERRRQMSDRAPADPPLGLRRLAGIV